MLFVVCSVVVVAINFSKIHLFYYFNKTYYYDNMLNNYFLISLCGTES